MTDYMIKLLIEGNGIISVDIFELNEDKPVKLFHRNTNSFFINGMIKPIETVVNELCLEDAVRCNIPNKANTVVEGRCYLEQYHAISHEADMMVLVSSLVKWVIDNTHIRCKKEYIYTCTSDMTKELYNLARRYTDLINSHGLTYLPALEMESGDYVLNDISIDGFCNLSINIFRELKGIEDECAYIQEGTIYFKPTNKAETVEDVKGLNIFITGYEKLFNDINDFYNSFKAIVTGAETNRDSDPSSGYMDKMNEYRNYIDTHISKVIKGFERYGEQLCECLGADYNAVSVNIELHDDSKTDIEEFDPYRRKFYRADGEEFTEEDELNFQRAWLHHIHYNPHHPEHWILTGTDDGIDKVFDMPPEYIVEMLLDWDTFKKDGKNGAYDYYFVQGNKKEGLLSDKTRELVERGLQILK